jgi:hypothetical protein
VRNIIVFSIAFAVMIGFYKSSTDKKILELGAMCASQNERLEFRENAAQIDFLPYPFANYHYACSGDPRPYN